MADPTPEEIRRANEVAYRIQAKERQRAIDEQRRIMAEQERQAKIEASQRKRGG